MSRKIEKPKMNNYQTIIQSEESVEVFPNQTSSSPRKNVSYQINGIYLADSLTGTFKDCLDMGDSARQCPPNQDGIPGDKLKHDEKCKTPTNSSRRTFSDPISSIAFVPIKKCNDVTRSVGPRNETLDMEIAAVHQRKIKTPPRPPSAENAAKCKICEYRSSIEKWHFPDGLIYCPKCRNIEAPLLRTKSKKMKTFLRSTLCANCMLYCWPLCFLPYLTMSPPQNYLHCPECFTFLGMYDAQKKCIQPNHEYVEYNGCFSAEESRRRAKQQEQNSWKANMFMSQVYSS